MSKKDRIQLYVIIRDNLTAFVDSLNTKRTAHLCAVLFVGSVFSGLQQAKEKAFQSAVGYDIKWLDLVGRSAAHHLQIPVKDIGLGLYKFYLQRLHDFLLDFLQ